MRYLFSSRPKTVTCPDIFDISKLLSSEYHLYAREKPRSQTQSLVFGWKIFRKLLIIFAILNLFGCTSVNPLIDASFKGESETVKTLLDKGTDVNFRAKKGITALIIASLVGHKELVKLLLVRGADINAKDDDGATALYVASRNGHKDIVELLLERGADVNAKDNTGLSPFAIASLKGHEDIAKLLLAYGANE